MESLRFLKHKCGSILHAYMSTSLMHNKLARECGEAIRTQCSLIMHCGGLQLFRLFKQAASSMQQIITVVMSIDNIPSQGLITNDQRTFAIECSQRPLGCMALLGPIEHLRFLPVRFSCNAGFWLLLESLSKTQQILEMCSGRCNREYCQELQDFVFFNRLGRSRSQPFGDAKSV